MDVLHTAVDVTDIDATVEFYEDVLDLHKTKEADIDGQQNYWVGGEGPAELQFQEVDEKESPKGINHIAIATDDMEAVIDQAVSKWDSTVEMEPTTIGDDVRVGFITDPEDYTIELIEQSD